MFTTRTVCRFFRLGLAASLLQGALLVGLPRTGMAAEMAPTSASVPAWQTRGNCEPDTQTAPVSGTSGQYALPPLGAVGFGWG
jgi:hypothetical protein